jgi:hypothetical protein
MGKNILLLVAPPVVLFMEQNNPIIAVIPVAGPEVSTIAGTKVSDGNSKSLGWVIVAPQTLITVDASEETQSILTRPLTSTAEVSIEPYSRHHFGYCVRSCILIS